MNTESILQRLNEYGFTGKQYDDGWGVVAQSHHQHLYQNIHRLQQGTELIQGRGQSHTTIPSSDGSREWFVKQYHHGGLLSETGNVTYDSEFRFLKELLATLQAKESGINTPEPEGVIYQKNIEGTLGFYVSRKINSTPLSRLLRDETNSSWAAKTGQLLAELHASGIDHGDFQIDNLMVGSSEDVFIVDFDPVQFRKPESPTREFRLHRFLRSLSKNGLHQWDRDTFISAYRNRIEGGFSAGMFHVLRPFMWTKNTMSDLMYWIQKEPIKPINLEKILIRAPNWLGDTVMSLPFIQILSEELPDSRIDVVTREPLTDVYSASPCVDRVWTIRDGKVWSLPEPIEKNQYSASIVIPKSFRTAYQSWKAGIPRRFGFSTEFRSLFLTDRKKLGNRDRSTHHSRLYFDLLPFIDTPQSLPDPKLQAPDAIPSDCPDKFLERDYITVHPGSAYGPAKRWPAEHFNQLLQKLLSETDFNVLGLGVSEEETIAQDVFENLDNDRLLNLVGQTTLRECMNLLSKSQATVANDSGIMHLSAGMGTPVVGIFGSTDPSLTSPVGQHTDVIYKGVECSPCFEEECPLSEDRYKCLNQIEPGEVFDRLMNLISTD
ncbi:MAG: lipopolysaccharide heptosyltransferase II [bacterium]